MIGPSSLSDRRVIWLAMDVVGVLEQQVLQTKYILNLMLPWQLSLSPPGYLRNLASYSM